MDIYAEIVIKTCSIKRIIYFKLKFCISYRTLDVLCLIVDEIVFIVTLFIYFHIKPGILKGYN